MAMYEMKCPAGMKLIVIRDDDTENGTTLMCVPIDLNFKELEAALPFRGYVGAARPVIVCQSVADIVGYFR